MASFIKIILLSASIIMVGCAPKSFVPQGLNVKRVQPKKVVLNYPLLGSYKSIRELGDTLVSKIIALEIEVIKVNNSIDCCLALTFLTGTYTAIWEDNTGVYYGAPNNVLVRFTGKRQIGGYVVPFGSRSSQQNVAVWQSGCLNCLPTVNYTTDSSITFTRGKETKEHEPLFKQELIYNGKSGSNIKFLYRELSNDRMRAPFTQDIQYDLNESNVIGFKGSRIKVIEATNRQIKYVVLKPFP
jgi:hypothetical protein